MFDYLRRSGFYPFVFICALFSANSLYAVTNTQTISPSTSYAGITTGSANFTDADFTIYGTGDKDALSVNNITINYNGSYVNGLQTVGAVDMKDNTLTLTGGEMTLNGDMTAARVTINNNASSTNADLSGFNFSLKDNTVAVDAKIDNSSGAIYGAIMESNESGVGSATVTGNKINVGSSAALYGYQPALTGALLQMNTTVHNITSNAFVTSNQVNVAGNIANEYSSNITGGRFIFNVNEQATHKNYNITTNLDSNQINLSSGKFYGNVTGAEAIVSTSAEYQTLTLAGDVQNNQINVTGGQYEGNVFIGGKVSLESSGLGTGSTAAIDVHDNTISVSGGKFTDTIFVGGMTTRDVQYTVEPSGNITGNTIKISGTPTFQGSLYLFGGYTTGNKDAITGNTLSIKTNGILAYGVDYFDTYNFDVSGAAAGDTYLSVSRGNGHNNYLFSQYESGLGLGGIDMDGVTFTWRDGTLAEDGRPSALGVGESVTLLVATSSFGLNGTIANNGTQEDILAADGNTYSYKLLQVGNKVELLHNGLSAAGNWTSDINFSAGNNEGEDVFMHVDSGSITSSSISVTSTANAAATLTAQTLDLTAQDTALTLNGTTGDKVKFNTITIGGGHTLTKSGSGFYSFDNMTLAATASVNSLDAMNGAVSAVTVGGPSTFDTINIGAGSTLTVTGGTYDFNTLGVYGDGNTLTGDLAANGKNLNFYLDSTTAAGATALTVSGNANIADSNVKVGITGSSSALKKDDKVVLVQSSTLTGDPSSTKGVGMQGLFLTYDFDLESVGTNQLVATVTRAGLTQAAKAFSEGRAASIGLISQGADFAAQTGVASAANAAWDQNSLALFTAFGGGRSRLETGSHVDMNNINAMVGLSREVSIFKADFVVGSFVEYGHGRYHTYNEWEGRTIKGSGNTDYTGLGALARWYGQDGSYVESVLHAGVADTDFSGVVENRKEKYDFDTMYYGGHFGIGRVWNLFEDFDEEISSDTMQIDTSAKYFLNHQEGKEVSVSSGDELTFHEANSSRLRVGLKANFFASGTWRPYLGVAYDREFNGKAKASTYNMTIDAPSIKGNTGIGEIGLSYVTKGFTFGIGAEGYTGVRRGWSGNVKVGFTF